MESTRITITAGLERAMNKINFKRYQVVLIDRSSGRSYRYVVARLPWRKLAQWLAFIREFVSRNPWLFFSVEENR